MSNSELQTSTLSGVEGHLEHANNQGLPKGWRECKLGELCKITRGASPRPIQNFMSNEGMPWVKISDATLRRDYRYIDFTKEFIIKDGVAKSRIVEEGELIVSNSATPGLPKFMGIRACVHDGWLIIRDLTGITKSFFYYMILSERERLLLQGNGSIFTNLKTDILKNHKINLPPLAEQKAIAEVLSSLDDKIDLLHKQNQTLEDMAQTLFREWFIEPFDSAQDKKADEGWEERFALLLRAMLLSQKILLIMECLLLKLRTFLTVILIIMTCNV
ncbi:restriction endonuclease subunit S [Francisella philomiragia]